jgi:hypothetical protein
MHNLKIAKECRDSLSSFYNVIKGNDGYLKFIFITGISKFSKTSVFSGMNSPDDISLDDEYATICGYTQDELENIFHDEIKNLAIKTEMTTDETLKQIKRCYDGYSWNGSDFLYNPHSILLLFRKNTFSNYWFETGTPTFLVDLIKTENNVESLIKPTKKPPSIFSTFEIDNPNLTSVLLQTGYLTIKHREMKKGIIKNYYLDIPNMEVKKSLFENLVNVLTNCPIDQLQNLGEEILRVKTGDHIVNN